MRIRFSRIAQLEYDEIIHYLFDAFGKDKAVTFSEALQQNLKQVKQFPQSFSFFQNTDKRKFMVNPFITNIYSINDELGYVEILNFWFNRSDPGVLLKHL